MAILTKTKLPTQASEPEEKIKRGQRIQLLRKSIRYSAYELGEKYKIPPSSIKSWEQGRFTGLTLSGAFKLVDIFQAEGIHCTFDWLYHGNGPDPLSLSKAQLGSPETSSISKEIRLFHQLHPDAIDTIVADDGMEPFYTPGDYLAGVRHFEDAIKKLEGKNCIVQLQSGEILVRKLSSGKTPGHYNLACLNSEARVKNLLQKDVQLFSAASILWIRKPG